MVSSWFDPHLIKIGVVALIFVGRAIAATNRKQKAKNRDLRPPQSAPAPMPIAPPTPLDSRPSAPRRQSGRAPKQDPDSPWSTTNGPFD